MQGRVIRPCFLSKKALLRPDKINSVFCVALAESETRKNVPEMPKRPLFDVPGWNGCAADLFS
jgi:hypothetical protein